ncbi:uncharacterized protein LOC114333331 [Diabrotica virgifera virgifera]|uniref:Uncharacterized protein LOC114333331 n=1 Tax=Diabrotica virgifera virgifera TaxID=50390 RepID=A0A6P7FRT8_DIAVI|nr:uncharacterized protein LOC114333331 [Diabrotica virgifera virgifera]
MAIKNFSFFIILVVVVVVDCAPKRPKKGEPPVLHTVYDQQQKGDYNIQLHLKDFQIIAVLGDDVSLGDYDYTYDYSDFTVKPSSSKPTEAPSTASPSVTISSSSIPPSTASQPNSPISIVSHTEESSSKPDEKPNVELNLGGSSEQPLSSNESSEKPISTEEPVSTIKPIVAENSTFSAIPVSTELTLVNSSPVVENAISNSSTTQKTAKLDDSPGKIKVQIIETPIRMSVVPGEDVEQNETLPQGEILQLRRCATGFTRDKRGRCRRVRRPANLQQSIPFGFSRFASNLATRLRQTSEDSSISSSESKED